LKLVANWGVDGGRRKLRRVALLNKPAIGNSYAINIQYPAFGDAVD
jgi:hypothetical protein